MRIGVDLLALQAPSCRGRGIGRYAKSLLRALLAAAPDWEFVFYRRDDLALDWDDDLDHRVSEWVAVPPDDPSSPDGTLQRVIQANSQRLDWLLVLNPVVERQGFALPEPSPGGPRLAAVVYDLIPALFPKHYLDDAAVAAPYARDLRKLQGYDLLLGISEATVRDVAEHLNVPSRFLANIRGASDPAFFRPATAGEFGDDDRHLAALGVAGPFFYYLGNVDRRKNVLGLVDAYALLPETVRQSRQLVLTFGENAWFRRVLQEKVEHHKLVGRVVATGPATDEAVRALYRRAELFLSPSLYEGFGLPTLEAMHCGAAVVVADNSSQPEVVGQAGVLAKSDDPAAWAQVLTQLVADPGRLAGLRAASPIQAAGFSWEDSARRLKLAIETVPRRLGRGEPHKVALIPYPCQAGSTFDPGSAEVFDALRRSSRAIVFLESARAATLPPLPIGSGWHEKKLLARVAPAIGKPPRIYLVDTLDTLDHLIADLEEGPGVVALVHRDLDDLADLVPGPDEDGLRRLLELATAVVCHSDRLRRRLERLAEGLSTPLHPAPDDPRADLFLPGLESGVLRNLRCLVCVSSSLCRSAS